MILITNFLQNNHTAFLPPLPSLNALSSTAKSSDYNSLKFYSKQVLNLLIIGTTSGHIHLSVFGMLSCCEIDIVQKLNIDSKGAVIKDAKMSCNFKQLFVTVEKEGLLEMYVLENDILQLYSTSLLNLAIKHAHILGTMAYINDTIECIVEAWETVLLEMDNKLTKYASSQPQGSISADFLELLMFGCTSTALEQFLLRDLTEKGLKKLGNNIELSYSTIQKLVVKPLHTAICSVFYHLNTLQGMILNVYYYKPLLGDVTNEALINCGSFLIKAYELQQTIDTSTRDFKIFFRWLYIVIVRLMDESLPEDNPSVTQQEINYLAEFLDNFDASQDKFPIEQDTNQTPIAEEKKRKFNLERVGQYLEDKPLSYPPTANTSNQWAKLLEQNECLKACPLIFPHHKTHSLVQQHNLLKASIDKIFEKPIAVIGQDFKQKSVLSIRTTDIPPSIPRTVTFINHPQTGHSLLSPLESENSLILAECNPSSAIRALRLRFEDKPYFQTQLSTLGDLSFKHVQFYNDETLSLLLRARTDEGRTNSYFLQLELTRIRDLLESIPFVNNQTITEVGTCCRVVNAYTLIEEGALKLLEGLEAGKIAVSGPRNVAAVVSESAKTIRIYDMDSQEEEDELLLNTSQNDGSFNTSKESVQSN